MEAWSRSSFWYVDMKTDIQCGASTPVLVNVLDYS